MRNFFFDETFYLCVKYIINFGNYSAKDFDRHKAEEDCGAEGTSKGEFELSGDATQRGMERFLLKTRKKEG